MSWGKTLADDLMVLAEYARDLDPSETISESDVRPSMTVRAPCCGRWCGADMVVDCRGIAGIGREWLCDACRGRFLARDARWTKPKLMRAMGAPPEAVRVERARELAREILRENQRTADTAEERLSSRDALERARARMSDSGMPDGTDPPGS